MITNFFIPELNNHDIQELCFQQDGATYHTARATIDLLKDTFGDRLISRFGPVNWPSRSCDLTPLDYFLWGYVKSLVYADKPQTLDHLEDNVRRVIADIRTQMLEKVIENWTSRLDYIRASRGSPMPEIIFKMTVKIKGCTRGRPVEEEAKRERNRSDVTRARVEERRKGAKSPKTRSRSTKTQSLKPGSLVLYIDNAGGGFHQMIRREADSCNLITVFGPVKHELYTNHSFNVKRFGYTPCLETRVSVHMWQKPRQYLLDNSNFLSNSPEERIPTSLRHFDQSKEITLRPPQPVNQFTGMNSRVSTNIPFVEPVINAQAFRNTSSVLPEPTFNHQQNRYIYTQSLYSNTNGIQSMVANQYIIDTRSAGTEPEVRERERLPGISPQRPKRQRPPAIQSQPRDNSPVYSQINQNDDNNRAIIEIVEEDNCCACCVIS
ncbi:uncharacterized protein TNCV_2042391 [Trichonephila clavipes]|nr:uncharacterized protein TNCV_2042391 [Trichonephila clavipes]